MRVVPSAPRPILLRRPAFVAVADLFPHVPAVADVIVCAWHPQSNGILAPIANVAGTVAGAAAVAQLAITPDGTSVVLCAAVADTTVASLRVRDSHLAWIR